MAKADPDSTAPAAKAMNLFIESFSSCECDGKRSNTISSVDKRRLPGNSLTLRRRKMQGTRRTET
jgi:hypothetical protein